MSENNNSGIKNILRGRKTKVKNETSPNELYIKAVKIIADGLVGKMLYWDGRPVLLTDVKIGKPNFYGELTSNIEVIFMADEKILTETFLNWEQFRLHFRTREEHEETLVAPVPPLYPETFAELATDLEKNLKNIKMTMAIERLRVTAEHFNISKTALFVTRPLGSKPTKRLTKKNDKT